MRGTSADSRRTTVEALSSAVDGGADASRLADDLFGAADVLRREASLRRVATDVSIAAEAKADLIRQVFSDKLDPASLEIVATAAGRRWAASRDLAGTLEELAVIAVVRSAEQAGEADALEDEIFAFDLLVSKNAGLRDALSDPARSVADKRALLNELLDGKATPATIRLAEQSISGSHRTVAVALDEYQRLAAEHRNRLVATVRVARELADQDAERLQDALAGQYGRPVHLNVLVDPDVIGGLRVEIDDEVIDGTVSSRLDDARRRLAG